MPQAEKNQVNCRVPNAIFSFFFNFSQARSAVRSPPMPSITKVWDFLLSAKHSFISKIQVHDIRQPGRGLVYPPRAPRLRPPTKTQTLPPARLPLPQTEPSFCSVHHAYGSTGNSRGEPTGNRPRRTRTHDRVSVRRIVASDGWHVPNSQYGLPGSWRWQGPACVSIAQDVKPVHHY